MKLPAVIGILSVNSSTVMLPSEVSKVAVGFAMRRTLPRTCAEREAIHALRGRLLTRAVWRPGRLLTRAVWRSGRLLTRAVWRSARGDERRHRFRLGHERPDLDELFLGVEPRSAR